MICIFRKLNQMKFPYFCDFMHKTPILFILFYVLFRLFLLPIEHSGDGWGYACEILKGDLFAPHHILYKPLFWGIFKSLSAMGISPEPIQLFSFLNVIFGGLCLTVFYAILKLLGQSKVLNLWLLILVSFTFGFIRYSGENETYILPLLFSLAGTYYWLKTEHWKAVSLMFVAVLFHQIHIFWLLAFFFPQKKNSIHVKYLLTATFCLIGFYLLYALAYNKNWYLLPFSDVQSGYVEVVPGIMNFVMTPISFFRIFFQVHGNVVRILSEFPFTILCWISLALICFLIISNRHEIGWTVRKMRSHFNRFFSNMRHPLGMAFILHLFFAFYSVGNAEFMVMLPFLLIFWQYKNISYIPLKLTHSLAVILGLWNLSFWIIPSKFIEFEKLPSKRLQIQQYIAEHQSQTSKNVFIGSNHVVFSNFWEYQQLRNKLDRNDYQNLRFLSIEEFELEKDKKGKSYFTDEISSNNGFNRKKLTSNIPQKSTESLWNDFVKIGPDISVLATK